MSTKFSLRFKLNQTQALNPSHGSTSNSKNSAWPQSQNFMRAKTSSKSHQPFPEIRVAFCSLCISPASATGAVTDHRVWQEEAWYLCLFIISKVLQTGSSSYVFEHVSSLSVYTGNPHILIPLNSNQSPQHHYWFPSPQNLAHWAFDTENWMQGKWKIKRICYFTVFHINALQI